MTRKRSRAQTRRRERDRRRTRRKRARVFRDAGEILAGTMQAIVGDDPELRDYARAALDAAITGERE